MHLTMLAVLATALTLALPARAERPVAVDVALVLAVDVSGSIDKEEFKQQREGYVTAVTSPSVLHAIATGAHGAIAITYVEWSAKPVQVVGWTIVRDAASAEAFAAAVALPGRASDDWTSLSAAIEFSTALFGSCGCAPIRRVIDISGDGINNNGGSVTDARDLAVAQGIVINGLPILNDDPGLDVYFLDNVIGGGGFIIPARDFEDFTRALIAKLTAEIS